MSVEPLPLDDRSWLLVLTGAGVSAESGVPTFRGIDGLWRTHPVERVASPDGFDYTRLAAPLQIAKPDLVAPDCVTTPFSNGKTLTNNQFCGTSAAVPSVAAAAALLESAGFNRDQVLKAVRSTASRAAGTPGGAMIGRATCFCVK